MYYEMFNNYVYTLATLLMHHQQTKYVHSILKLAH
jgi:hypothetical protein